MIIMNTIIKFEIVVITITKPNNNSSNDTNNNSNNPLHHHRKNDYNVITKKINWLTEKSTSVTQSFFLVTGPLWRHDPRRHQSASRRTRPSRTLSTCVLFPNGRTEHYGHLTLTYWWWPRFNAHDFTLMCRPLFELLAGSATVSRSFLNRGRLAWSSCRILNLVKMPLIFSCVNVFSHKRLIGGIDSY